MFSTSRSCSRELKKIRFESIRPNLLIWVIIAPFQYFAIKAKVRRVFKNASKLFQRGSYSESYLSRWILYFEMKMPRKHRTEFRENLLNESVGEDRDESGARHCSEGGRYVLGCRDAGLSSTSRLLGLASGCSADRVTRASARLWSS